MKQNSKPKATTGKIEAVNRRASFDIAVADTYEAGLVLTGDEIKSIRAQRMQLSGSFVRIVAKKGAPQAVLLNLHLGLAAEPTRSRPLLLHSKELDELSQLIIKGSAIVPLKVYIKRGWAKVLIGVGKGRKNQDKRHLLRERDLDREEQRGVRLR